MVPAKRYSRQRAAILEVVKSASNHPTAEMVYEQVRESIPNISLGTVYRNLRVLTEEEKIREVVFDDNIKRYEDYMEQHYHCICTECGKIQDIPGASDSVIQAIQTNIPDFDISSHRLELYGTCDECQE
ncbi:MAG: transcriptional repressor [Candidatus Marinimicrobia bacterium]|nr:transcriptional repressor [Candidatus Neomarinimicrobiota bacterium]MCF7829844.1 transcriptional repressor [Candidatus Neomarinimicrobiota bacterium]MCF7882472.1 transcriptional repressor [Candidatus Neomarinimicrobiota bacterium]